MAEGSRETRSVLVDRFLAASGWGEAARRPLAGDASFRRYLRLERGSETAVLMDAPPPHEDVRPYVRIARLLHGLGLSAPAILAEDPAAGLLLTEDLGDDTYARLLEGGANEQDLYALAVDALVELHRRFDPARADGVPQFADARAIEEAERLLDWFWPARFDARAAAPVRAEFAAAWTAVLPILRAVPQTLVHFDFHIDNLLRVPGRSGVAACGMVDFQDAVLGPLPFDLVSLIEDVRRDVPEPLGAAMIARYLGAMPGLDRGDFLAAYAVAGAQRNTRIAGNFVRLCERDRKPQYLRFMPRVWRLIARDLSHPALAPVQAWFDRHLPTEARALPPTFGAG